MHDQQEPNPTFQVPDKNNLFSSWTDTEEQRLCFEDSFPTLPSKERLRANEGALCFLSDKAFLYYLPYFIKSYENDPMFFDMLVYHIEGNLERLKPEIRSRYKAELAYWEARLKNVPGQV